MKKNKGFTLAELLIVIAIIAVLVGISIPVFGSQLEKAREVADAANIRAAYAEVMTSAFLEEEAKPCSVVLTQQSDGWDSKELESSLKEIGCEVSPTKGMTVTVSWKDSAAVFEGKTN